MLFIVKIVASNTSLAPEETYSVTFCFCDVFVCHLSYFSHNFGGLIRRRQ